MQKLKVVLTVLYSLLLMQQLGSIKNLLLHPVVAAEAFTLNPAVTLVVLMPPLLFGASIILGWKVSGWYFLLGFIPILGFIAYMFLIIGISL